jgi:hypothetical protein
MLICHIYLLLPNMEKGAQGRLPASFQRQAQATFLDALTKENVSCDQKEQLQHSR